jgi:hypothetical protein
VSCLARFALTQIVDLGLAEPNCPICRSNLEMCLGHNLLRIGQVLKREATKSHHKTEENGTIEADSFAWDGTLPIPVIHLGSVLEELFPYVKVQFTSLLGGCNGIQLRSTRTKKTVISLDYRSLVVEERQDIFLPSSKYVNWQKMEARDFVLMTAQSIHAS